MTTKKFTKICPQCGSTNITIPPAGMDIRMTLPDYCADCSNKGTFPEIEETQIAYFKKMLQKK